MMIDLPSSDQASSEGLAMIPIVGNNTERRGESVLLNQTIFIFIDIYTLLQLWEPVYIRNCV